MAVLPPPAGSSAARTAEWAPSAPTTTRARTPATTGFPAAKERPVPGTVTERTRRRRRVSPRATAASTSRASFCRPGTTRVARAGRPAVRAGAPPRQPGPARHLQLEPVDRRPVDEQAAHSEAGQHVEDLR